MNPGQPSGARKRCTGKRLNGVPSSGARVHEPGCQGCIGMGQAPGTGEMSLRTFPRNFPGRSGSKDDKVYFVRLKQLLPLA